MVCPCHRCTMELVEREPWDSQAHQEGNSIVAMLDPRVCRMFLCETCGNKRCPHAADHRLACTGSNAPGQKGSLYEDAPVPPCDSGGLPEGQDAEERLGAQQARAAPEEGHRP